MEEKMTLTEKIFMVIMAIFVLPFMFIRQLVCLLVIPAIPAAITSLVTGLIGMFFSEQTGLVLAIIGAGIAYIIAFILNLRDIISYCKGNKVERRGHSTPPEPAKPIFGVNRIQRVQNIGHNMFRHF